MPQGETENNTVTKALLALGANLSTITGRIDATLERALSEIQCESTQICRTSSFYHSPAFPAGSGPDFVNAAAEIETELGPEALLDRLHRIEAALGRERRKRWGARVIDLDLLAYGDMVLPDATTQAHWRELDLETQMVRAPERLILPHPRMQDRAFVLIPLAEIAPDWRHPLLGLSVAEMAAALPEEARTGVSPIGS
ncbi:2-amino-4-hydroxy-6-hydroxymethyldihydropteridine diphosphokinase [Maritimibacter sp. 55A14]|uniref:2-amino-4-hydroxy-6- hydroxymethyldihydropteridine diphosphokinase n=1 Tax=Maritimibacter sp. 55A14 TaxID=2174844 RepID=UPI000D618C52|nr:2-amino-4-hydroxy-6-hydroxymethyldihydropteridine diphosphokinase [Maritimibacter sp. 55A14]PWE32488.1 2-amino-4-hydroxy-6-hydroxymethyldihydropteridine diphosphokinase [Maritimibacter sp. 55A14]